ncbi:unnamed protein product [Toxocara canis]|uniref:Deltameth_res domain-containing protein n=1 Tax=Toxocara canis TaxID=6265 RepID=A0A183UEK4_TOXCA|nr:unnamed protein product [Toxocara canis]
MNMPYTNDADELQVINPGPPVTLDYMPVPFKPYKSAYNELQAKFNMYLGVSVALLTTALALAFAEDLFSADALRPPLSYRLRNK